MNKSSLRTLSKISVVVLILIGLAALALALWTVFDDRYRSLAYNLADVGYIVSNDNLYTFFLIISHSSRISGFYDIYRYVFLHQRLSL